MSEIRHIISNPKELWALKDRLEILTANPLSLHKTAFLEYLRVKGEILYSEASNDEEIAAADAYLTELSVQWKEEAKAINERRARTREIVAST